MYSRIRFLIPNSVDISDIHQKLYFSGNEKLKSPLNGSEAARSVFPPDPDDILRRFVSHPGQKSRIAPYGMVPLPSPTVLSRSEELPNVGMPTLKTGKMKSSVSMNAGARQDIS